MLRTRVIPCLLLRGTALVKTVKFDHADYIGDALNTVRIFNELEVDEIIVLDIDATRQGREPNYELIGDIASECFMPLSYGGGLRSVEQMQRILRMGVEKVAINTALVEHPAVITAAADAFGSQCVVASIDARRKLMRGYRAHVKGGTVATDMDPVALAERAAELGAGEILLTAMDRDGTWEGYDLELTKKVAASVSVPVIACGGAGKPDDFGRAVREAGASAVAVGSMVVYQKKGLGVLVNFPSSEDLARVLGEGRQ